MGEKARQYVGYGTRNGKVYLFSEADGLRDFTDADQRWSQVGWIDGVIADGEPLRPGDADEIARLRAEVERLTRERDAVIEWTARTLTAEAAANAALAGPGAAGVVGCDTWTTEDVRHAAGLDDAEG